MLDNACYNLTCCDLEWLYFLFFVLFIYFFPNNIVLIDPPLNKSMLSGGDKKYDIGSDPLPALETNFVLGATLKFMNGPYI